MQKGYRVHAKRRNQRHLVHFLGKGQNVLVSQLRKLFHGRVALIVDRVAGHCSSNTTAFQCLVEGNNLSHVDKLVVSRCVGCSIAQIVSTFQGETEQFANNSGTVIP